MALRPKPNPTPLGRTGRLWCRLLAPVSRLTGQRRRLTIRHGNNNIPVPDLARTKEDHA